MRATEMRRLCTCLVVTGSIVFAANAAPAAEFDPYEKSITEVHEAMAAGEVTARQLVEYYLARIEVYDKQGPAINSIICASTAFTAG